MVTGIATFFIILLLIICPPLLLNSCKQTTPQKQTQAKQQETQTAGTDTYEELLSQYKQGKKQAAPQPVENPVFAQWRDMRARRVPEGTKVRWRIKVWVVLSDYYLAKLEGKWDYNVKCPRGLLIGEGEAGEKVFKTMAPAQGDWVEIQGRFAGVTSRGDVRVEPDDFTNLGPGY